MDLEGCNWGRKGELERLFALSPSLAVNKIKNKKNKNQTGAFRTRNENAGVNSASQKQF